MTMPFLYGALAAACITVALFFLRYFRSSKDRLFMFFALAFVAFALNYIGLTIAQPQSESRHLMYLFRLAAFLLIIAAILDKNRREGGS